MSEFDEIIARLSSQDSLRARDEKIEFYKKKLYDFYNKVRDYLKKYEENGNISIKINNFWPIHQEGLGDYKVPYMKIKLGIYTVSLLPKGTDIIGAHGRIDMTCEYRREMFILVEENVKNISDLNATFSDKLIDQDQLVWKYVSPSSEMGYKDVDKEIFLKAFMSVINGK